ncbi:RNA-directed DNA polymerase, eukaryota [Tanacetum coccineum]
MSDLNLISAVTLDLIILIIIHLNNDHTQRISHSVYVTNFPDSVNSRDLRNSCSAYGTVIDVFIPVKKSKAGKRFAFVRFIKVNNLVRLVENLCTIWIGRHHLFANQVRYERPQKPYSPPNVKSRANIRPSGISGLHQSNVRTGSYANIVNGMPIAKNKNSSFPVFDLPASILDETCANDGDLSRHVMGRVKALNSIPNLKTILTKKGFGETKLSYLRGLWVMIELNNMETKNDLLHHTRVKSWFHELQDGTFDFVSNERIVWVDIEGIPLSVWSHATFSKIGKKWGELMDIEESAGSFFARKRICIKTNMDASILETFKVIFKGKTFMVRAKELFTWTLYFLEYKESEYASDDELPRGMNNKSAQEDDILVEDTDDEGVTDIYFGDNSSPPISNGRNANDQEATQHSEDPFGFYNLLKKPPASIVLESDPSLTHPPGYTPEPSQQEIHNDASDPSVTEPSSEFSTSFHSRKTYNGGSILDVLDDVIKVGQSMGYDMEGCSNDIERIISLQGVDATVLKRTLWDYIPTLANRWNGEMIVLGDFNEVRSEEERFGSIFNQSSARAFNQFIASSGLIEVKIEGFMLTLGDSVSSFTTMGFYHSWLEREGFDTVVTQAWQSFTHNDSNRIIRFKKKLKGLKQIIRVWIRESNRSQARVKKSLVDGLVAIDKDLDMGINSDDMLLRRLELTRKLHELKQSDRKDVAQKAKVQWAIEGDENSKYFHGIINKRRA